MNTNGLILLTLMVGFVSFGAPRPSTAPASATDKSDEEYPDDFESYSDDGFEDYSESEEEEEEASKPTSQPRPSSASSSASSSKSASKSRHPSQSAAEAKSSPEAESTSLLTSPSESTFLSAREPKPASPIEAESPLELLELPALLPELPRPASPSEAKSPRFSSPRVTAPSPQSPRFKSPKTTPREAESPESVSTRTPSPRAPSLRHSPRPSTAPAPLDLPQKEYPTYLDVLSNGIATLINTSTQIDSIKRQFAAFMDKDDNFRFVYYRKEDIAAAIKNNVLPKAMRKEQYKYICIALCAIALCQTDHAIKGRIVARINRIFAELQKLGTNKVPIIPGHRIATMLESSEYLSGTAALRQSVDRSNYPEVIAKASKAGMHFYKGMQLLFNESRKDNEKISGEEFDGFMQRFFEEWKNILSVIGVPQNIEIKVEKTESTKPFFAGSRSRILKKQQPSVF